MAETADPKSVIPGHQLPIIAIVGRPNVGKSTLFNRLINRRLAITSEIAGTTRDRIYYHTTINSMPVILVDTGGLEYGEKEQIEGDVQKQVKLAIDDADLIVFVFDAKDGLTIEDFGAADKLRKSHKQVLLVANKSDAKDTQANIAESYQLGFGEPVEISAYHNRNIDGLTDEIENLIKKQGYGKIAISEIDQSITNIGFVGKPNVGKSSLVNALLGENKVIVSDIPGTTRDAIDTPVTWNDLKFNLIDTAGLRRRGKIEKGLEKLSSFRSLEAIERSDVVCLILDFSEGIKKQDQHIASYILEAGKGLVLVVNKCDLMEDRAKDEARLIRSLRHRFDFLPWAPVIFVSALKHGNIEKIFDLANTIHQERYRQIGSEELDGFMKEITYKHLPPPSGNVIPKFYHLEQTGTNPPTFTYYVNKADGIHFSYRRYLENEMRAKYGFNGTSIRIIYKNR